MSQPDIHSKLELEEGPWQHLAPDSRVWIYQANRALSSTEVEHIISKGEAFTAQWQAHGQSLSATLQVFFNRFVVLFVDENKAQATGCSIDTSVHLVQELGRDLNIDFFDRMHLCYVDEGVVKGTFVDGIAKLVEAQKFAEDSMVFDNTVGTKEGLENSWISPLSSTWVARYL